MGEERMEIEVKEMSRETIKPSSPTPSHLTTYTLSLLDQSYPLNYLSVLLFYPPSSSSSSAAAVDLTSIKHSLAETLSQFYPLAGRLKDISTVSCTDEGIPLIQTRVSCLVSDVVDLPRDRLFGLTRLLLPPRDLVSETRPISELPPLAFQVNVFKCGGVVIGWYMLHKLLDGVSVGTFIAYWAAHTNNRFHDLVDPDFSSGARLLPPCRNVERLLPQTDLQVSPVSDEHAENVVAKRFVFTKAAMAELKTKAATGDMLVRNPSSFEVVAAFVWEHAAAAAPISGRGTTSLLVPANMRTKTTPPLPNGAIGNLVVPIEAKSENWGRMAELLAVIRGALSTIKDRVEEFQGENGTEAFLAYREALMPKLMGFQPGVYSLSSCCKLGFEEADFGFGKPQWAIPVPVDDDGKVDFRLRNFIMFTTHVDPTGDGIDAWLILEQNEMQILESNPRFLAYASPN